MESSSEDGLMSMWTEKRATPNMDYNESNAKCPLPGCDSKGKWSRKSSLFMLVKHVSETSNNMDKLILRN